MSRTDAYTPTSERLDVDTYLSSASNYLIYLFHIAAYDFATRQVPASARVLDYGCGTGYGAAHLTGSGRIVVGVDVSEAAVRYARERYQAPGLQFSPIVPVEKGPLPFEDGSFDAVVSFQVIEHVPSVDAYLAEVTRVLRPGGTFFCATPDRATRLFRRQRPWNRWHLGEFTQRELAEAVSRHLEVREVMGMTAPAGVVDLELRRARVLRATTVPFTFPGAPEGWRVAGLTGLRTVADLVGSTRARLRRRTAAAARAIAAADYPFGLDDIVISASAQPSTNIVLTATRRSEPHPP